MVVVAGALVDVVTEALVEVVPGTIEELLEVVAPHE